MSSRTGLPDNGALLPLQYNLSECIQPPGKLGLQALHRSGISRLVWTLCGLLTGECWQGLDFDLKSIAILRGGGLDFF